MGSDSADDARSSNSRLSCGCQSTLTRTRTRRSNCRRRRRGSRSPASRRLGVSAREAYGENVGERRVEGRLYFSQAIVAGADGDRARVALQVGLPGDEVDAPPVVFFPYRVPCGPRSTSTRSRSKKGTASRDGLPL